MRRITSNKKYFSHQKPRGMYGDAQAALLELSYEPVLSAPILPLDFGTHNSVLITA